MKSIFGLGLFLLVGVAGWQIGNRLSPDAIGMALGVLFGVMAGIPASLMVLAAAHKDDSRNQKQQFVAHQNANHYPALPQQPPVIVITGQGESIPQNQAYHSYPCNLDDSPMQKSLPGPIEAASHREFRVVGETEEVLQSW